MLINQSIKDNQFHSFFASFSSSTPFLFLLSVLTFFAFPILGCIPILLLLQVRISQRFLKGGNLKKRDNFIFNQTNLFYLFLVLFATTIYLSTSLKFSDLEGYLKIYSALSQLDVYGFINNFPQQYYKDVEPLAFFLPHLAGMLFGHSDSLYILVNSLTFNLVFIFLAYKFFPLFYPSIILINITSYYYFQTLIAFRQSYSFLFLLPMALLPSIALNSLFLVLAYFSHRSSTLYSIPLFFLSTSSYLQNFNLTKFRLFKPIQNKTIKLFALNKKLFVLLTFSLTPLFGVLFKIFVSLNKFIESKQESYAETAFTFDNTPFFILAFNILPEFILFVIILAFLMPKTLASRDYKENSFFVVALVSLAMVVFTYSSGSRSVFLRPLLSWNGLKGFFYPILFLAVQRLRGKDERLSRFLFKCLICLASLSIVRFLIFNFYSIYCAYQGGDVLDAWREVSPYSATVPVPILSNLLFFHYPNFPWNNHVNMPTVATNLFDYLLQFYHLIESIQK